MNLHWLFIVDQNEKAQPHLFTWGHKQSKYSKHFLFGIFNNFKVQKPSNPNHGFKTYSVSSLLWWKHHPHLVHHQYTVHLQMSWTVSPGYLKHISTFYEPQIICTCEIFFNWIYTNNKVTFQDTNYLHKQLLSVSVIIITRNLSINISMIVFQSTHARTCTHTRTHTHAHTHTHARIIAQRQVPKTTKTKWKVLHTNRRTGCDTHIILQQKLKYK